MTDTSDDVATRAISLLRERAEMVLNAIDDGVYFLDPLGNTVFVNEAAARLLGYTAREMLGKPQHELIHHHYPDGSIFPREGCPIYSSVREGVQQRVGGDTFWRKDGTPLHVDYTSVPLRERREIVGAVVTFRDISAQQRADEQEARLTKERAARAEAEAARQSLLVSDQRYRALVQAAGQHVWTNSPEGRMEGDQPGWTALTGQSSEDYQGFGWANAVHPDDAGPTVDAWHHAVATRSLFAFEHRVRVAGGDYRRFSIRAVPILNADGTIREWVGAHTDITEQRAAFAEAQHARTELARVLEQAPAAIATLDASSLVFRSANARYRALTGGRDVIGKTVLEAFPEMAEQPFFIDMLHEVIRTGSPYAGDAIPAMIAEPDGTLRERVFDFVYQPITRPDGTVHAVMVHAIEVGNSSTKST